MKNDTKSIENIKELNFNQGMSDFFKENSIEEKDREKYVKAKIAEFFNMKNVCFLFGAGTSAYAIPNMETLYDEISKQINEATSIQVKEKFKSIVDSTGKNLEQILGILYSGRSYYSGLNVKTKKEETSCSKLIELIEEEIFNRININFKTDKQLELLEIYKQFYQKIAFRNKDLSRVSVFTTNNDLYNERALDDLNIHYINGFSGGIRKFFNPSMFNYTYSKRMDVGIDKYEPVENMVYLYKIHGSVNWIDNGETEGRFFSIEETSGNCTTKDNNILIYPTPTKQNKSLGAPYVDLFREFQHRLLEANTVLFVMGYGFNDEHVNDIIYRALATNTTFNVVIIDKIKEDKPICKVDDKRVFRLWGTAEINGKETQMHYFDYAVREWLPDINAFSHNDDILNDFVKGIKDVIGKDDQVQSDK